MTTVYCITTCFAAAHAAVALVRDGDVALLVRDAERAVRVRLQRLPADTSAATVRPRQHTPRPHAHGLALVVQPWNATCTALRVNDVLYTRGSHPVVLRVGDQLQLCAPGVWDDDKTFCVIAATAPALASTTTATAPVTCNTTASSTSSSLHQQQQRCGATEQNELARWSRYYHTYYGTTSSSSIAAAVQDMLSCNDNSSDKSSSCRGHDDATRGVACQATDMSPWEAFASSLRSCM